MCNNDVWKKIKMKRLELKNIRKSYNGRCVLDGISAVCSSSQPVCVRGVSGAGKTTLLNIIMGLVNADEGELVYNDEINVVVIKMITGSHQYFRNQHLSDT